MTETNGYESKRKIRRIAVEEHFSCPEHVEYMRRILEKEYPSAEVVEQEKYILNDAPFLDVLNVPSVKGMLARLYDVGEVRITDMDRDGIDIQVVSLVSPGIQVFEPDVAVKLAKKYNDELAALVKEHPERFVGLASIAPQKPEAAADELERCVKESGFRGAVINSHTRGEYLDEKKYRVIFERAQKLAVPVYIHPRGPSPEMIKPYLDYPMLGSAMMGFGAETSLHAMRLICSGIFDEYPKLTIVLGHLGEGLPGYLMRIDSKWSLAPLSAKLQKLPGQYFKDNFVVTTSGMFTSPALVLALTVLGPDKILFAVDYPMEATEEAVSFMETAPISEEERGKIYHINAERVFGLR